MKKAGKVATKLLTLAMLLTINACSKQQATMNALFMKQAGYSEEDIKAGTAEFEKNNPGAKISLTFVAYEELEKKIITSAMAGSYDVVLSDAPFTAKFAQAKIVKEAPPLSAEAKEDLFSNAIQACMYKNKLYGMPWLNDCKYLFYNKKMLKQAGFESPPKTWDELVAQAKVLKEKKIVHYPLVWSWMQAECLTCDFTILSAVFGSAMFDENGNPTLTDEGNKKALDFMCNSIKEGFSNPKSIEFKEDDVLATFANGDAAFALNWTYMYDGARDPERSKVANEVGIALVPGQGTVKSATVNGGQPLAISAGSRHADMAWKYIQYMTSKDFQKQHPKNALPVWKSLYDDKEVVAANPDIVAIAKEQYTYLVNRPQVPFYSEFSMALQVKIQEALLGKKTAQDALNETQAAATDLAQKR